MTLFAGIGHWGSCLSAVKRWVLPSKPTPTGSLVSLLLPFQPSLRSFCRFQCNQIATAVLLVVPLMAGSAETATEATTATPPYIAGLQPSMRPADAPVIRTFTPDKAWEAGALRGIDEPRRGIDFLAHQGAWYTPFVMPNMPGRYDIRRMYPEYRAKGNR